jgi:hypothetical protein
LSAKRQRSDSYSETANEGSTIFDAPNVCREIMAKCQSLAERVERAQGEETHSNIANEIRAIGDDAKKMLDAIVASTDRLLAMEAQ